MKNFKFLILIVIIFVSSCTTPSQNDESSIYFNMYYLPDNGAPYIDPSEPSVNINNKDLVFVSSTNILFIFPKIIPNDPNSDIGDSVISFSNLEVLVFYNKNNSQYYALGDSKLRYEIEMQLISIRG